MSSSGRVAGLKLTPRSTDHSIHNATRPGQEDQQLLLCIRTVIGMTTTSANAFDSDPNNNIFAYCAGPAAVVSLVDENLNVTQRLFRARPNASPLHSTPSFYNPPTPPSTRRGNGSGTPFRDRDCSNPFATSVEGSADILSNSKAQNRVKEATCVSMSRNGDYLAVGETGYNPRLLLFSMRSGRPEDIPSSVLTDHSFGVQSIAFSNDSRWLCSLGSPHDGFLLLYSVSTKAGTPRLYSSNKCSNVHSIVWMGPSVISIGTRHVKVWRVERADSPIKRRLGPDGVVTASSAELSPRIFQGRNCILGSLINATFTCAVAISDCKAIICTARGDVCLLDDSKKTQRLEKTFQLPFDICCVHFDCRAKVVWFGCKDGQIMSRAIDDLGNLSNTTMTSDIFPSCSPQEQSGILAIGSVRSCLVTVDSARTICWGEVNSGINPPNITKISKQSPAHHSAVLGACSLANWQQRRESDFLTYSSRGTIFLWDFDGICWGRIDVLDHQPTDMLDAGPNELKIVIASDTEEILYAGDKIGMLRSVEPSGSTSTCVQAHSGDVNGIATTKCQDRVLVATCGRDRTLQLFEKASSDLTLLQTLEEHAAAVTDLMFLDGGAMLVSISSDKTILIRRPAYREHPAIAYLPVRVIALRASPVSFAAAPFEPNILIVSTMDRLIQRYDLSSGRLLHTFRAQDPTGHDSVLVSSLQVATVGHRDGSLQVILAVSSTDKTIRLHNYDNGSLLAIEYGQSAVSSVRLMQHDADSTPVFKLISCGFDGTIIVYDLSPLLLYKQERNPSESLIGRNSPLNQTPTSTRPVRKTLKKSEIAGFYKAFQDSQGDTIGPIRSHPPSRVRKTPCRRSLATPHRPNKKGISPDNHPVETHSPVRNSSHNHSPTSSSPTNAIKAHNLRSRPCFDYPNRSKSAAHPNDLNASADQICNSLRTFRKNIISVGDKLKPTIAKELQQEFELTADTISENSRTKKAQDVDEPWAGESVDTHLAKMIDERLALAQRDRVTNTEENARPGFGLDDQTKAGDAAKQ